MPINHIKLDLIMKDGFTLEKLDAALQSVGFQMEQIESLSGNGVFVISREIGRPEAKIKEEDRDALIKSLEVGNISGGSVGHVLNEESWTKLNKMLDDSAALDAKTRINAAASRCPTCPGPAGGCCK